MKTNIISNTTGSITKTIVRLAAVAALAVTAFIAVEQNTPKADADNLSYVKLCTYYSPGRSDFYSTTSRPSTTNFYGCAPLAGYNLDVNTNEMILDPTKPQPFNTVAVYNWWDGSQDNKLIRGDQLSCATPGVTRVGNFTCTRKEGFVFKTAQTNAGRCGPTVAMSTAFSTLNNDHASFRSGAAPGSYVSNLRSLGHAAVWFC